MGTSSSFGGTTYSLVPTWAEDENENPSSQAQEPQSRLASAKGDLTSSTRGGSARHAQRAISKYISATGHSARTVAKFHPATKAHKKYLGLIGKLSSVGFGQTVNSSELRHLNLAGKSVTDALIALTDLLCHDGGQLDEAEVRNAWIEAVSKHHSGDERPFQDLSTSEHLVLAQEFLTEVVISKICMEIGSGALCKALSNERLGNLEIQLHDFVRGAFADLLNDISQIGDETLLDNVLERAFSIMEAEGDSDD